jgi:Tol biopolymer transport system component
MIRNPTALLVLLACLSATTALGHQAGGNLLFCKRSKAEAGTYVADAAGQNLKRILFLCGPDIAPRFAPDGTRIVFTCPKAGQPWVWIAARDGQDRKAICEGEQGTWSADGARIFFRRGGEIVERDHASGTEKTVSPPGWKSCAFPDCSPDGKRLVFCAEKEGRTMLLVTTLGGRDTKSLSEKPLSPETGARGFSDRH